MELITRKKSGTFVQSVQNLIMSILTGESLQINKRGKAYAIVELLGERDDYDRVLNTIEKENCL